MDFIFVIGSSAVGKTTLAKKLYQHYNGVYIEQNMVPEFIIPKDVCTPNKEENYFKNIIYGLDLRL